MFKKIAITGLLTFFVISGIAAADNGMAVTRRFGIFIGSNNGGRERVMLRYAVSDAKSVSRVFGGMGGIAQEDNILLVEPNVAEINRQLDNLGRQAAMSQNTQRTELVFYYSGHSDENGILLNRERYGYRELRERINTVQSDMRIVILDSCSSGAMTRAKGGVKTQPFLFDSSVSAAGYAILTSSSATEASQESDHIESSYFTHSLLAGLRGAADSIGDGRVTLNELYRFAYAETLAKTETSIHGAQHPSFDIQISGSGDVVLTDVKETSAGLLLGEDLSGRISIRDSSDFLVAELTKAGHKPMELGLEPGTYRITLQQGNNFYRAEVALPENRRTGLGMKDFLMIAADTSASRNRGDADSSAPTTTAAEATDGTPHHIFNFQVVPGFNLLGYGRQPATNNFLLGLFLAQGFNVEGIAAAPISVTTTGSVHGVQASGIFNRTEGDVNGVQAAGIFNKAAGEFSGVQAAGIFNDAAKDASGVQAAGIFNKTAGNYNGGVQAAGIFNRTAGSYNGGTQAAGIFNQAGTDFKGGIQAAGIHNRTGGNFLGIQAAGIFNYTGGSLQGMQSAGIGNYTSGEIRGMQTAGIFNHVNGNVYGMQAAGIFNKAEAIEGVQAGLVNTNKAGKGAMFGLVNVSESEDNMVPFGLVNVIKNGIMHPVVYVDDMLFTNIGLRSGSKHFYSFFSMGVGGKYLFQRAEDTWLSTRFGFGFEYCIGKLFFNIDTGAGTIHNLNFNSARYYWPSGDVKYDEKTYFHSLQINQIRLTVGYKIFQHLGIFAGISYDHLYHSEGDTTTPKDFGGLFIGDTFGRHAHKLGFFGGIQF